jgi:hypothetical protein
MLPSVDRGLPRIAFNSEAKPYELDNGRLPRSSGPDEYVKTRTKGKVQVIEKALVDLYPFDYHRGFSAGRIMGSIVRQYLEIYDSHLPLAVWRPSGTVRVSLAPPHRGADQRCDLDHVRAVAQR